ncbi:MULTISPECIES: hypothetical protein [Streptomyces]|uniref:hypothetical protein n=1 Tax=Streptomyces TaxID=1883 RepID=UPI001D0487D4|nr:MULTISPECIES: hypothetical protein [Streptomyces]
MTTSETTPTISPSSSSSAFGEALRRLYFVRFAFAIVWAALLVPNSDTDGPLLTTLLVVYPLFDAAAVLWQLHARPEARRPEVTEWINVAVSALVAVALGVASTMSIAAALGVWGAWAIGSGIPQLVTAVRNRRSGGQVPQMLSGGISVLAGSAFLAQGLDGADDIAGVAGYAVLGGVFFLVSAIHLSIVRPRKR